MEEKDINYENILKYARLVKEVKKQLTEQDKTLSKKKYTLSEMARKKLIDDGIYLPKDYPGYDTYNHKYTKEYHEQLKTQNIVDNIVDEFIDY